LTLEKLQLAKSRSLGGAARRVVLGKEKKKKKSSDRFSGEPSVVSAEKSRRTFFPSEKREKGPRVSVASRRRRKEHGGRGGLARRWRARKEEGSVRDQARRGESALLSSRRFGFRPP